MHNISKFLSRYDLVESTPSVLIRESSDNIVYSVGEKNKIILRVSKRLALEDVRFEFEAMQHVARKGVPVPKWIMTKENNFYSEVVLDDKTGKAIAVAFEFLEGIHAQRSVQVMPTVSQAWEAGKALALLHNAGADFVSDAPRSRTIFSELERVGRYEEIFNNEFEGGTIFIAEVSEALKFGNDFFKTAKDSKAASGGFIHNDYRVGNVFFKSDDKEKIKGIIDFDWGCVGPFIKDVALGVVEWSFPDETEAPNMDIFDSFLEGYNSAAIDRVKKDVDLYRWIWLSGLSDTATWLCDNILTKDFSKRINRSYMYRKAQYFKSLMVGPNNN